jgi:hypothetical protein
MKIMIAGECSGRVRNEFRSKGHDAWSFDLYEDDENKSWYHRKEDAVKAAYSEHWDMLIAFMPCTHLCVSGARHFEAKRADGRQQQGIDLFMSMVNSPIKKQCHENPIGIMSTIYRKPDQIIQPWMFGHGETKATCLWLKGLPLLKPTKIVSGRDDRIHRMPPGPNRAKERSRTYMGIAEAMADQWG